MVITIANESFSSQKSLQDRCKAIKSTVSLETPLIGSDFDLISKVISLHPDLIVIAPIDQSQIFVSKLPFGKTGFYIQYPDSQPQVVGLKKAIKAAFGKTSTVASKLYDLKLAGRAAIAKQILAKRREYIGNNRENLDAIFVSDLSGQEFPMSELAIDHTPPLHYDTLLLDFVKAEGINPIDVTLLRANGWTRFADEALAERWRAFHQERAVLRAISSNENAQGRPLNDEWLLLCGVQD